MSCKLASYLVAALVLMSATAAAAQTPRPWLVPELLAAAKSEGSTLTIYASMNEEEALPYWAIFEQATGIKVNFVRMSDSNIRARIAIEHRAGSTASTWSRARRSIGSAMTFWRSSTRRKPRI